MAKLSIEITPELAAMLDELCDKPRPPLSPMAEAALARLRQLAEDASKSKSLLEMVEENNRKPVK